MYFDPWGSDPVRICFNWMVETIKYSYCTHDGRKVDNYLFLTRDRNLRSICWWCWLFYKKSPVTQIRQGFLLWIEYDLHIFVDDALMMKHGNVCCFFLFCQETMVVVQVQGG